MPEDPPAAGGWPFTRPPAGPPDPPPPPRDPPPADPDDELPEYEVVGENHIVFNTLPGDRFRRRIPAAQEARLIRAGHIKRITKED
jgi:hypothetical protein